VGFMGATRDLVADYIGFTSACNNKTPRNFMTTTRCPSLRSTAPNRTIFPRATELALAFERPCVFV